MPIQIKGFDQWYAGQQAAGKLSPPPPTHYAGQVTGLLPGGAVPTGQAALDLRTQLYNDPTYGGEIQAFMQNLRQYPLGLGAQRQAFEQRFGTDFTNFLINANNFEAQQAQAERQGSFTNRLFTQGVPLVVAGGIGAGLASGLTSALGGAGGTAGSGGTAVTPYSYTSTPITSGATLGGGATTAAGGASVPNFFQNFLGQITSDPLRAITGGASLLSNLYGARQQGQLQDQSLALLGQASNQFNTGTFQNPFGTTAVTPEGIQQTSPLGGSIGDLSSLFGSAVSGAGTTPGSVQRLMSQLTGQGGILPELLGSAGDLAGRSALDAFTGAGRAETHTARAYDLLTRQAQPQEQAALESFKTGLRNTGRGAVTGAAGNEASIGGGRLAAAFAQGQSRADLDRQLAAQQYGERTARLEEDLVSSAFRRFSDTTSTVGNLGQSYANTLRLPTGFAADQLGLGTSVAGIFGNLAQTAQSQFNPLFNLMSGRSNALLGQASGVAGIAPNASPLADALAAFTGGIFSNIGFGAQGEST